MPTTILKKGGVLLTVVKWDCDGPEGHATCTEEFKIVDQWDAKKKKEEQSWFEKFIKKAKALFGSDEDKAKEALEGVWNGLQGEDSGQLIITLLGIPEWGECNGKTRPLDVTIFAHVTIVNVVEAESGSVKGKTAVGADFKVTLPYDWAKFHIADCPCEKPKTTGMLVPGFGPHAEIYVTSVEPPHLVVGRSELSLADATARPIVEFGFDPIASAAEPWLPVAEEGGRGKERRDRKAREG